MHKYPSPYRELAKAGANQSEESGKLRLANCNHNTAAL